MKRAVYLSFENPVGMNAVDDVRKNRCAAFDVIEIDVGRELLKSA